MNEGVKTIHEAVTNQVFTVVLLLFEIIRTIEKEKFSI